MAFPHSPFAAIKHILTLVMTLEQTAQLFKAELPLARTASNSITSLKPGMFSFPHCFR